MPHYLVTTRRDLRASGTTSTALAAVQSVPGVTVLNSADPQMVTIEASHETAESLKRRLENSHFVEPMIHRGVIY
jgi:hypothetical protein